MDGEVKGKKVKVGGWGVAAAGENDAMLRMTIVVQDTKMRGIT